MKTTMEKENKEKNIPGKPPLLGKKRERKEKRRQHTRGNQITTSGWTCSYIVHEPLPQSSYILLKCKNCGKKLSSMGIWIVLDKDYWMRTHYYYKSCHRKRYGYSKKQNKWNNESCLTCSKQLLNEEIWNNIPGRGGMCDTSCQYMIFISDWVSHDMPITAAWHQVISRLEGYPHDKDKICEILEIKNNSPEPTNIILVLNPDTFLDLENSPEEFHKHYQNLAPTREEQEQWLEEINIQLCDYCLIPCDF
ncbi:hypothetical protein G9A89_000820 [Geosiphon pyriformis]|nr:hypothetical protein G9A89_000820 [Geosiphon pyriformis]